MEILLKYSLFWMLLFPHLTRAWMAGGVAAIECHEEEGPMRTVAEDEVKEEEEAWLDAAEIWWVALGAKNVEDDEEEEETGAPEEADASDANT
jgi:hypothetical protein